MAKLLEAIEKAAVKFRRKRISVEVFEAFEGTVQYGPFKGLKINGRANTSRGNLGAKVLGLYEPEVMQKLVDLGPFQDVVNFGAADGYISLGVVLGGLADRSICFEMDETGRKAIAENAEINGVADRIVVCGVADDSAGEQLFAHGFNSDRGLVVCDIEGAEFAVLSKKVLTDLKGATLIVELHDRLMAEGLSLREQLIARLPEGAKHQILKSEPADWRGIDIVEQMTDNDRALVCSDGRKVLGEWLIVTY